MSTNALASGAVTGDKIASGQVGLAHLAGDARSSWASVNADGSIAAQSGGVTVALGTGTTAGVYYVDFGTDVSNRVVLSTPHFTSGGTNVIQDVPEIRRCGNSACPSPYDNTRTVVVVNVQQDSFVPFGGYPTAAFEIAALP